MNNSDKHLISKNVSNGPTFTLSNRLSRFFWNIAWFLFARFTPNFMHKYRIALINLFGGNVHITSVVYPTVKIWAPWNLEIGKYSTLGPNVNCYNLGKVIIGDSSIVSQNVTLCTATHDYDDEAFKMILGKIEIGNNAWICDSSYLMPNVIISEGVIIGANSTAVKQDYRRWSVYAGNPTVLIKNRKEIRLKFNR